MTNDNAPGCAAHDGVEVGRRRYHFHGWTIYDVTVDGRRAGAVSHPGPWMAYDRRGGEVAKCRTRAEAIDALVSHVRSGAR